ncbi:Cysteine-rich secretory protein family protein [Desulfonatronum thiosulfatophilum]|uniref:Cysteine-rich secretory protein family protein n=1 Tax=Desulfonatronum thiosulfatophilum TaxID=617002 RepID=A0A1G6DIR9_9BACT|nr:CAP domain-containing protein [Desulfonatronum thiosulfatophilum]SDB45084.1 Cysteine-rich secretory protein family protein [Desulfonatronum thiosulfatophilum]
MRYLNVVVIVLASLVWLSPSMAAEALDPEKILEHINEHRSSLDLEPLNAHQGLNAAAKLRVEDMLENDYFAHINPETGEGPMEAIMQVDYDPQAFAENIAMGTFQNEKELVQGWLDSPEHRENIERSDMVDSGLAIARDDNTDLGMDVYIVVQLFGSPMN